MEKTGRTGAENSDQNPYQAPSPAPASSWWNPEWGNPFAWIAYTAVGAIIGYIGLHRHLQGPGDPHGTIVGPVCGGFLGLMVSFLWRSLTGAND
jgi:hypothetical protein